MGNCIKKQSKNSNELRCLILTESDNLKNMIINNTNINDIKKKTTEIRNLVKQLEPTLKMQSQELYDELYVDKLRKKMLPSQQNIEITIKN